MIRPALQRQGITLADGGIGVESYSPYNWIAQPQTLGVALETGVPTGSRILWDGTSGCPAGYTMVTSVAGKYLRLTSDTTKIGDINAADSGSHSHSGAHNCTTVDDCLGGGHGLCTGDSTASGGGVPTYPAIKYILCEKQ